MTAAGLRSRGGNLASIDNATSVSLYCWFSDPNKDSTGGQTDRTWPEYNNDGQQVLVLDTDSELSTQTGLRDRYCQFWDKLVPRLHATTKNTTTGTDLFSLCVILRFIQHACSIE